MNSAQIIQLPRSNLSEGRFDPNLTERFSGDEMKAVWKKIDALAMEEVGKLVAKYESELRISPEELNLRIAIIAGFFLRESAEGIYASAYDEYAEAYSDD